MFSSFPQRAAQIRISCAFQQVSASHCKIHKAVRCMFLLVQIRNLWLEFVEYCIGYSSSIAKVCVCTDLMFHQSVESSHVLQTHTALIASQNPGQG